MPPWAGATEAVLQEEPGRRPLDHHHLPAGVMLLLFRHLGLHTGETLPDPAGLFRLPAKGIGEEQGLLLHRVKRDGRTRLDVIDGDSFPLQDLPIRILCIEPGAMTDSRSMFERMPV